MPRGLSPAQKALLAAPVRRPAYFVRLDFASGVVRVWSGVGNVVALGGTWLGVGEYGFIDGIESDVTLRAKSISFGISGVPGSAISGSALATSRAERYQYRPVSISLGFLDLHSDVLLGDPTVIWSGFADVLTFRLGSTISAVLSAEHMTSLLRQSNGLRATTESHNERLGNPATRDLFFEAQDRLMNQPRPVPGS